VLRLEGETTGTDCKVALEKEIDISVFCTIAELYSFYFYVVQNQRITKKAKSLEGMCTIQDLRQTVS
tara:strand:+ start:84064 stop:84264 length:201 start_codon:yes stop_codon:yes gene_type:complete